MGLSRRLAFAPDGTTLGSLDGGGIKLWDVIGWREAQAFGNLGLNEPSALAFSADSGSLVVGYSSGALALCDVQDRRLLQAGRGHSKSLRTTAISPDGTYLAVGQADGAIRLYDSKSGAPIRSFRGNERVVNEVSFSSDGEKMASACADGTVRFWTVATAREIGQFSFPQDHVGLPIAVFTVAFSPDGKTIAAAGADGKIRIWEVASRAKLRELTNVAEVARPPSDVDCASSRRQVRSRRPMRRSNSVRLTRLYTLLTVANSPRLTWTAGSVPGPSGMASQRRSGCTLEKPVAFPIQATAGSSHLPAPMGPLCFRGRDQARRCSVLRARQIPHPP